jgi:DNA repair exonuclease SbcCD ATPase subunit
VLEKKKKTIMNSSQQLQNSEAFLAQAVETAIGKSRELAIKLAEREKAVQAQQANLQIGEREYETEKARLETAMIELSAKKQKLLKLIEQRRKDLAQVSSKVAKLEDTDQSFSMNRAVAFVPNSASVRRS